MHHHRPHVVRPDSRRLADEAEQWKSELWDAHVGPLSVMVVQHRPLVAPPLLGALQEDKTKQEINKKNFNRDSNQVKLKECWSREVCLLILGPIRNVK